MTALDVILIVISVALALALLWSLTALRRDRRLADSREAMTEGHRQRATEATATAERSQAEMHRAEAELHEARARIAALQQERGPDAGGTQDGGRRRSLFRREPEPDPEAGPDPESERTGFRSD